MVLSTLTAYSAAATAAGFQEGSVAVFSDGTDTAFLVRTAFAASTTVAYLVKGADLVSTTSVGTVNNTTANFGFTLGAVSGTAGAAGSAGVTVTLA